VLGYGAILLAIAGALLTSLLLRTPFKVDVVRDRTALARQVDDGRVENVYRLQMMNASEFVQRVRIDVSAPGALAGAVTVAGPREIDVGPTASRWMPVAVQVSPEAAARAGAGVHPIEFHIEPVATLDHERAWRRDERSTFVVPH
jgi:polyferredoxin